MYFVELVILRSVFIKYVVIYAFKKLISILCLLAFLKSLYHVPCFFSSNFCYGQNIECLQKMLFSTRCSHHIGFHATVILWSIISILTRIVTNDMKIEFVLLFCHIVMCFFVLQNYVGNIYIENQLARDCSLACTFMFWDK